MQKRVIKLIAIFITLFVVWLWNMGLFGGGVALGSRNDVMYRDDQGTYMDYSPNDRYMEGHLPSGEIEASY